MEERERRRGPGLAAQVGAEEPSEAAFSGASAGGVVSVNSGAMSVDEPAAASDDPRPLEGTENQGKAVKNSRHRCQWTPLVKCRRMQACGKSALLNQTPIPKPRITREMWTTEQA